MDAAQWEAYCRIVLITFRNYVEKDFLNHSFTLFRAFGYIKESVSDLYKINGVESIAWDDDIQANLRTVINFIKKSIEILDKKKVPKHLKLRIRNEPSTKTIYDHLANMIVEIIFAASAVRSPISQCWLIQHNSVYFELFNNLIPYKDGAKVVMFKVRRLLYDEIAEMKRIPNYKGAKILGFCLNVMGFVILNKEYRQDRIALQKAVLSWTKQNFVWLYSYNPTIGEECLVDGITYDEKNLRLVKTYPINAFRPEPKYIYLNLNPPSQSIDG